ncbi:F0F1 ATP synthase subunit delta [Aquibacillus koreensis]|uniref:ATP synthase subunit delta n=1 Tax=Aquibacillus koreensis TaxID=279446 RepID=A0A9X3WHB2_9BACI|nr:F0F1 ATP synthase subunit delta [Aquibacillus koreensis]MCT2535092.1 F0F1 ATP synthase subunit delta [Aquibacillus koreensis]MDC3419735.1 F0F1 ATP synthase subunit delta [Aquibacillus koreensis]
MSKANVAKRYAEALFQLGQEKSKLDAMEPELLIVKEVFENNKEFNAFLQHPRVSNEKKKQLIKEAFQGFSADVVNTLNLLVDRHSEYAVTSIIDHFVSLVQGAKGIAEAYVYSVRELTEDEKKQLSTTFAKKLNKHELIIVNIVDPTILGGVKIKIGNTIYDGSIKGKLDRLERKIVTAN